MVQTETGRELVLDSTGMPMVWIEELGAFAHWLPLTKIQLEYFLCDRPTARYDDAWYRTILSLNPRSIPGRMGGSESLPNLFATGLIPDEVREIAEWYSIGADNKDYAVPTVEEWRIIRDSMSRKTRPNIGDVADKMSERARRLIETVDAACLQRTPNAKSAADFMLMKGGGVREWTVCRNSPLGWGGMGKPNEALGGGFIRETDEPHQPFDTMRRSREYGVRLLRRQS